MIHERSKALLVVAKYGLLVMLGNYSSCELIIKSENSYIIQLTSTKRHGHYKFGVCMYRIYDMIYDEGTS